MASGALHYADLVAIVDSLRRGDYWSAAARAVSTLQSFLAPASGGGPVALATAGPVVSFGGDVSPRQWDAVLSDLEGEVGRVQGDAQVSAPGGDMTRVDSPAAAINGRVVLQLVDILIQLFQRYRGAPQGAQGGEDQESTPAPQAPTVAVAPTPATFNRNPSPGAQAKPATPVTLKSEAPKEAK